MMATENRLIDANVFAEHLERMTRTAYPNLFPGLLEAIDYAKDFPTVDAVEVVHGRWLKNWCDNSLIGHEYAECSVCDCHMLDTNKFWNSNYCPNCGAKMDGDGNG